VAKLGVITDGISREFEHALEVMAQAGLEYAELQYLWDKQVGELDEAELRRVRELLGRHGMKVSCISRHIFVGIAMGGIEVGMAHDFGTRLVRVMSGRKEMILFGKNGAEVWNASVGAWDKLVAILEPAVELAESEDITLVVETGNNAMITSCWLGRKLINDLGTKNLKVLWDPANSLYCTEAPYPDGYESLRGGYLGHVHIKDSVVDIAKATVRQCQLGSGQMAPYLRDMAAAFAADGYDGVISLENVYRPDGGTFEDGFHANVGTFKEIFGQA
jgi:sugar phosphate isomerase/epimerase